MARKRRSPKRRRKKSKAFSDKSRPWLNLLMFNVGAFGFIALFGVVFESIRYFEGGGIFGTSPVLMLAFVIFLLIYASLPWVFFVLSGGKGKGKNLRPIAIGSIVGSGYSVYYTLASSAFLLAPPQWHFIGGLLLYGALFIGVFEALYIVWILISRGMDV